MPPFSTSPPPTPCVFSRWEAPQSGSVSCPIYATQWLLWESAPSVMCPALTTSMKHVFLPDLSGFHGGDPLTLTWSEMLSIKSTTVTASAPPGLLYPYSVSQGWPCVIWYWMSPYASHPTISSYSSNWNSCNNKSIVGVNLLCSMFSWLIFYLNQIIP